MQNLQKLRERLHELYRRADPYADGRPARQKDLADAIGLHPSELSNRLNQTKGAKLTPRDTKAIVHTLAEWGAIQTQSELVQQCCAALTNTRLLTLTGPGGIGKTRLGLAVTTTLADKFADGVYFVELAALSAPASVAPAIAASVGVSESRSMAISLTLVQALRSKHILLILDNCEHLLPAVVPLVESLLLGCPRLHILATSRELLSVPAELVLSVPPPEIPSANQGVAELEQNEAVALFVERARASVPDFQIIAANATALTQICRLVERIPLAIELASGWLKMLSVEQIADRLAAPLSMLGRVAQAVTHQQTLRACISGATNCSPPPSSCYLVAWQCSVTAGSLPPPRWFAPTLRFLPLASSSCSANWSTNHW